MLGVLFHPRLCHFSRYTSSLPTDGFQIDPVPENKTKKEIRIILMA